MPRWKLFLRWLVVWWSTLRRKRRPTSPIFTAEVQGSMTLKTKTILVCETCDTPILTPDGGFVLHGAIHTADPTQDPMLGTAIPKKPTLSAKDVTSAAYCRPCFARVLGLGGPAPAAARPSLTVVPQAVNGAESFVPAPSADGKTGGKKEVAPKAFVHGGPVLPMDPQQRKAVEGLPRTGDTVRFTPKHKHFDQLQSRAAKVTRYREDDRVFVLTLADGSPQVAKPGEIERIEF